MPRGNRAIFAIHQFTTEPYPRVSPPLTRGAERIRAQRLRLAGPGTRPPPPPPYHFQEWYPQPGGRTVGGTQPSMYSWDHYHITHLYNEHFLVNWVCSWFGKVGLVPDAPIIVGVTHHLHDVRNNPSSFPRERPRVTIPSFPPARPIAKLNSIFLTSLHPT